MKSGLIKINNDSLRLTSISIPKRTEKQLYFSNSLPITLNRGIAFSVQFNSKLKQSLKLNIDDLIVFSKNPDQIKKEFSTELNIKNLIAEPSIIYLSLSIKKPSDVLLVEKPCFNPIYGLFTPEQRWIYLNWLADISKPVAKYYVYLYYFCLERRICESINEELIDEIFFLANNHNFIKPNVYFLLFYAYLIKQEPFILDKIDLLHQDVPANNIKLYYYFKRKIGLTSKDIFEILSQYADLNKRYLKLHPNLYLQFIDQYLIEKSGQRMLNFFELFSLEDFPQIDTYFLQNRSIPDPLKLVKVYDIISSKKVKDFLLAIHVDIVNKLKKYLRTQNRINK